MIFSETRDELMTMRKHHKSLLATMLLVTEPKASAQDKLTALLHLLDEPDANIKDLRYAASMLPRSQVYECGWKIT